MQGVSRAAGGGIGGGKWKDKFRRERKGDIVAVTEGDGWRQSQIEAERKVKMSEEKENMNRKANSISHKVKSYTDKNILIYPETYFLC